MGVLFPILGLLLTVLALALLAVGGSLAAWLLLDPEGRRDPLTLAVAALLLATAQGVAVALALGAAGLLRLELALAAQTLVVLALHRRARRGAVGDGPGAAFRLLLYRTVARAREYPALALIALHAAGTEAARGLLRPPLSWDSLMYHLYLAAQWLQQESLGLVAARQPTAAYLYTPAEGSLWLWWWMAPSHSELYVNLAFLPLWLLLGLAAGAFARALGARRHWPVAAILTVLTPAVLRFAATQYVDVATAAALVSGSYFALRWIRRPRASDALLAAVGLGLAAGFKVLGLVFGLAIAGLTLVLARHAWRQRLAHLAVGALLAVLLGGFFYARNLALGGGLFGYPCVQQGAETEGVLDNFPARNSLVDLWDEVVEGSLLTDAFLGSTRPTLADLGLGPQVFLLLGAVLLLPFGLPRDRRDGGWLVQGQVAAQLVFWSLVPYVANAHILANVRYLDSALALAMAGAVALGERWLAEPWIRGLAIALAVQDLLMLHPVMPRQVRWTLAAALAVVVVLALSPSLRRLLRRHSRPAAAALALLALAFVPALVSFRLRDRERAFAHEYTAHLTSSRIFAAGWGWLDRNAGRGTVAVSHAPENYFVYPAMGPFLERRAIYVHVNEAAHRNALRYPGCDVRVAPSYDSWRRNLAAQEVRWLHVARFPELGFPLEDRWAREHPEAFRLRFQDATNRIYEVALGAAAPEEAQ